MPKLKNVTDAEIIACHVAMDEHLMEMHDITDRLEKGYADRIEGPIDVARNFSLIAASAARISALVLMRADLQRQQDELKALHERAGKD